MIRVVDINDYKEINQIYSYYIKNTAITFETEILSDDEMKSRIINIIKKYPFLVYVENDQILGYAYASTFKDRAAYNHAVELSIYVKNNIQKKGIGKKLYLKLFEILEKQNVLNFYSCIAYPNKINKYLDKGSYYFHKKLGFKLVGKFKNSGYKFNQFFSMIWMEKVIKKEKAEEFIPFCKLEVI